MLTILEANTSGNPNKLVRDFITTAANYANDALHRTCDALEERFGFKQKIARELDDSLQQFGNITMMDGEKV